MAASLTLTLARFWLGVLGATLAGFAAFGLAVTDPRQVAFQCVTVGALTAGMLALARLGQLFEGLLLAVAYGLLRYALAGETAADWRVAVAGLLLALGALLVATLYDLLAEAGFRFGKFLIVGPLLGGVFFAVAPLAGLERLPDPSAARALVLQLLLGIVIGDGAGLGVEVAEWLVREPGRATDPGRPGLESAGRGD